MIFGGSKELAETKKLLLHADDETDNDHKEGFITTSPLDYHLFRQEITSKYPTYNPPPPLVPLENENNSILPPLPNRSKPGVGQDNAHHGIIPNVNSIGSSIFNQPVHIATPAPSPPPSPAGPGGKGAKKQNYQTNQNFPFLYPPLDSTIATSGQFGARSLDASLESKWGSNAVPASISEAGELFASRMRMSRSIRQLWDVREEYIKFERGWDPSETGVDTPLHENDRPDAEANINGDVENDNLDALLNPKRTVPTKKVPKEIDDAEGQRRLDSVETFYVC